MDKIRELKDLNLLDRFLFAEASELPEVMIPMLEIILGKDVVLKHLPQSEKEIRRAVWSKIVRMDVLSVDREDTLYEMEVQKSDTGNLLRRSRAYNSYIDSKILPPGNLDYNALNDVYIIMVMPFDLFGEGKYMYTFRMMSEEVQGLKLNDGATRIFLNTRGTDSEGVTEELIELLHYFEKSTEESIRKTSSSRLRQIHDNVQRIKETEEVGIRLMNAWEEKMINRQEAYEEGMKEGVKETACKMKAAGMPTEQIIEFTGLTAEEIEKL